MTNLKCDICNKGYDVTDYGLLCLDCENIDIITDHYADQLNTKIVIILKDLQQIIRKNGASNVFTLIISYAERLSRKILVEQIAYNVSLKLFNYWIGCQFALGNLNEDNLKTSWSNRTIPLSIKNKEVIVKKIRMLGSRFAKLKLIQNGNEKIIQYNGKYTRVIPYDKPLFTTPKYVSKDQKIKDNIEEILSMYNRDVFKNSYLMTLRSYYLINMVLKGNIEKYSNKILIFMNTMRNEIHKSNISKNGLYELNLNELKIENSNLFHEMLLALNNFIKESRNSNLLAPVLFLYSKLKDTSNQTILFGRYNVELIFYIFNNIIREGETEKDRGAWIEDMYFRPYYGLNVKNELNGRKLLNVMNSDKLNRWKEIADFIVIGNTTCNIYVFEVKSRLITTTKWIENQLQKFRMKIPEIKNEINRMHLNPEKIIFCFINSINPISEYNEILIGNGTELNWMVSVNEGFKEIKLHDKNNNMYLHQFDHFRGIHVIKERRFRIDIGEVLGIDIEAREIGLIGYSPDNNLAIIWIDIPKHVKIPDIQKNDKILFLIEDTMGGDIILSLHDCEILSNHRWILWLSSPYMGDPILDKELNEIDESRHSDISKFIINSSFQQKAIEGLRNFWKKIAEEYFFGFMGPIDVVLTKYPFVYNIVKDIFPKIENDLPISIFTNRSNYNYVIVMVPYNGKYGIDGRTASSDPNLNHSNTRPFSEFSQAFWYLIKTGFFPNPKIDAKIVENILIQYTGKELIE